MRAEYEDLLIKKGEIYKEHIGVARVLKEEDAMKGCTFKPVLNDERNRRKGSRSKIRDMIASRVGIRTSQELRESGSRRESNQAQAVRRNQMIIASPIIDENLNQS